MFEEFPVGLEASSGAYMSFQGGLRCYDFLNKNFFGLSYKMLIWIRIRNPK